MVVVVVVQVVVLAVWHARDLFETQRTIPAANQTCAGNQPRNATGSQMTMGD